MNKIDAITVSNIIKINFFKMVDAKAELNIENQTLQHQKHTGFAQSKYHFLLNIKSKELASMPKVKAHQKVYACIDESIKDYIHALSIKIQG